ncbi:hypothetical protein C0Q70_03302 [Pomacea canaliculata]|uniref:Uncharacterized protein n=1 Tax=Pomacea canaliculata TaxID=400727 RepID=A0A2T7PSB7_POMCA|nr:hypothetical protein C0Q70_03302 [Pomacea canaliculata]
MSAGRQGREHQQAQFVFCYNRQLGRDASDNNRSGPTSEQPSPPASRFRVSKCLFHLHVVISWLYIYTSAVHFLQIESEQLCYKPAGVYRKAAAIQVWYYNNELEPSSLGCKESACSDEHQLRRHLAGTRSREEEQEEEEEGYQDVYNPTIGIFNRCSKLHHFQFIPKRENCATYVEDFLTDNSQFPDTWKAALVLFGCAGVLLLMTSLAAVLSLCVRSVFGKSIFTLSGLVQCVAGE